jgi:hypothetical protein
MNLSQASDRPEAARMVKREASARNDFSCFSAYSSCLILVADRGINPFC